MTTRRQFLSLTLSAAWLEPPPARQRLRRWWPVFPTPREVWVTPAAATMEEGMLLESVAGLAARAALKAGRPMPLVYEDVAVESYRVAFDAFCHAHHPKLIRLSLDEIIARLACSGVVRGSLRYRYDPSTRPLHDDASLDESANVATALAATTGGLAVSENQAGRMEKLGLKPLMDLRGMTEAACLEKYESRFSRDLLGSADPRVRHARSLMIALDAFVCSARKDTYKRALARCRPDTPMLGWGCGPEDTQTLASSRAGLYQTATDWCLNLPLFASEKPENLAATLRVPAPHHWSTLDWGDGNHYMALVMSDGDNVQWEMSNFARGPEGASYFGHRDRGRIPYGWGLNVPTLAQLAPRFLEDIFARATHNDGFLLFGGAGYFYPDLYGTEPGKQAASALHAQRLRGYMEMTGIRALAFNYWKWDSPAALAASSAMARQLPGLEGIFAFQYYPYSAGEGAVRWVRGANSDEVPVASCSFCVWARTGRPRDTTPAGVAAQLNRMERLGADPATEKCFSWVLVHAWSRFRRVSGSADLLAEERDVDQDKVVPGTERGYGPAMWTVERLAPHVKPVTPHEWLMRLRLRLRPRQTLNGWLAESRVAGKNAAALNAAERLLRSADDHPMAAMKCFDKLREAWR